MAEGKKKRGGAKPSGRAKPKGKAKQSKAKTKKSSGKAKPKKAGAKAKKSTAKPKKSAAESQKAAASSVPETKPEAAGDPSLPPFSQGAEGESTAPRSWGPLQKIRTLVREMLRTLKENAAEAVVMMIIGAAVGWLLNALMMMFRYEGFGVPPGAPATGESNLISGSLFWIVGSTLVFAVISYRRAVGRDRFWEEVRGFPQEIRWVMHRDGDRALGHLLWGFAGCLLVTQLLSPSISGVLAIALLVAIPSVLGDIISEILQRIWDELASRVSPTKGSSVAGSVATVVLVVGACAALAVAFFFAGRFTKLGLALLAGILAFVLGRTSSTQPSTPLWLLAAAAGSMVIFLGEASPAMADDGGWLECGGTIQGYLNCATTGGGTGLLAGHALKGAIASLLGAGLGVGLGGALGDPSIRVRVSGPDGPILEDPFISELIDVIRSGPNDELRRLLEGLETTDPADRFKLWDQAKQTAEAAETPAELYVAQLMGIRAMELQMQTGQMAESDAQQAQTIQTQIAADAQKQQMQRWKILQETQTKIFEIQQDVTVNKAKTQDKMSNQWDEYIRQ